MRDAADWSRGLKFERLQSMNVRSRQFVRQYSSEMFAIRSVSVVYFFKSFSTWKAGARILEPWLFRHRFFLYMSYKTQTRTGLERDLIQKFAEVEFPVMPPGSRLR